MMWRRGKNNNGGSKQSTTKEEVELPPPNLDPSKEAFDEHGHEQSRANGSTLGFAGTGASDAGSPPHATAEDANVAEPVAEATTAEEVSDVDTVVAAVAAAQYGRLEELTGIIDSGRVSAGAKVGGPPGSSRCRV